MPAHSCDDSDDDTVPCASASDPAVLPDDASVAPPSPVDDRSGLHGMQSPLVVDGTGVLAGRSRPGRGSGLSPTAVKCLFAALAVAIALLVACVGLLAHLVAITATPPAQASPPAPAPLPCANPLNWTQARGNVLIVHYEPASLGDNFTAQMAAAVASGARSRVGSSRVRVLQPSQVDFRKDILDWADAVVVGTPVYNANVHPVIQQWIDKYGTREQCAMWLRLICLCACLPASASVSVRVPVFISVDTRITPYSWDFRADLSNKVGAAFVTAGGMSAGEELVGHAAARTSFLRLRKPHPAAATRHRQLCYIPS